MKLFGIILLVSSAYLLGSLAAVNEGEKLKALNSLISMLQFLFRRMETENKSLNLLFAQYKDGYLEKTGFLPKLRQGEADLSKRWEKGLDCLNLEEHLKNELLHFGESLGRLGLEAQLKNINQCVSFLEQEKEKLKTNLPQKQKSIKAVAFLLGALTAIILI